MRHQLQLLQSAVCTPIASSAALSATPDNKQYKPLCEERLSAPLDTLAGPAQSSPLRRASAGVLLAAMVDGVSYRAVWVQCDRCKKWRQAPDWTIHPDESVPWFCEVRAAPPWQRDTRKRMWRVHTAAWRAKPGA